MCDGSRTYQNWIAHSLHTQVDMIVVLIKL